LSLLPSLTSWNFQYDVHIIAYSSLFRIINQFHQRVFSDPDVPNGLNRSVDFCAVTLEYDQLLNSYRDEWAERFVQDSDHSGAGYLLSFFLVLTWLTSR